MGAYEELLQVLTKIIGDEDIRVDEFPGRR
jgi:hypothetical protein